MHKHTTSRRFVTTCLSDSSIIVILVFQYHIQLRNFNGKGPVCRSTSEIFDLKLANGDSARQ